MTSPEKTPSSFQPPKRLEVGSDPSQEKSGIFKTDWKNWKRNKTTWAEKNAKRTFIKFSSEFTIREEKRAASAKSKTAPSVPASLPAPRKEEWRDTEKNPEKAKTTTSAAIKTQSKFFETVRRPSFNREPTYKIPVSSVKK